MNDSTTRRSMIKSSIAISAAALTLRGAGLISAQETQGKASTETQASTNGMTILFQGDSITDAGRDRNSKAFNDPNALGKGYPLFVASELLRDHAGKKISIYNRGISGNKVPDLDKRWDEDCIQINPDVLSILIGVNDIWHKLNGKYDGTVDDYYTGYTALIERTKKSLPKTRIVICEPFVLRCGAVNDSWFPEFEERRAMAERVATEHKLDFVPFQKMFNEATQNSEPKYWAGDGVHPSLAGHSLMAKKWLEVTKI
jgi:lysophospholipase L1-like esterase